MQLIPLAYFNEIVYFLVKRYEYPCITINISYFGNTTKCTCYNIYVQPNLVFVIENMVISLDQIELLPDQIFAYEVGQWDKQSDQIMERM